MLTDEQTRQLLPKIQNYLGTSVELPTLRDLVGSHADRAPALSGSYHFSKWVLDITLAQETPGMFIKVVRWVDHGGTLPELHTIVARLEADPSIWKSNQVGGLFVPLDKPFVDRTALRSLLSEMESGGGDGSIAVVGELGTGKSTLVDYVKHLSSQGKRFSVLEKRLCGEAADLHDLPSLVSDLQLKMHLDVRTETTHSEPERQAVILAGDISREAMLVPRPVWLVIDGIDPERVKREVLRFLDELLLHVQTPEIARGLRVLIFEEQPAQVGLENLPPANRHLALPEVTQNCVAEWLQKAIPGKPDNLYAITAATVLQRIQRKHPQPARNRWLEWLNRFVLEAHRKLQNSGL
ncbi:hypothetical protein [Rhodopirellula bahusiensis]|uniref:hypothetical protein n=1 Tax=Rhodopirellula bahusiensis TaxID=2014065 RepID=UPI0032670D22